jgi:hypothetical protein
VTVDSGVGILGDSFCGGGAHDGEGYFGVSAIIDKLFIYVFIYFLVLISIL